VSVERDGRFADLRLRGSANRVYGRVTRQATSMQVENTAGSAFKRRRTCLYR